MTEKTKKRLAIAGASAIGLALVVAIGMQFTKAPGEPDPLPQQPQSSEAVNPEVQPPDLVVTPPSVPESQPTESLPPQTDLPEQKLQPDPVKPEAPSEPPVLPEDADTKNPEKPPEYKPVDTEKKPAPPAPSTPQGSGGGLPGFDNVPDGGANQVIEVDGDGDINKQVGIMD